MSWAPANSSKTNTNIVLTLSFLTDSAGQQKINKASVVIKFAILWNELDYNSDSTINEKQFNEQLYLFLVKDTFLSKGHRLGLNHLESR